jgi:flagellar hook assembly protein FlgD
MGTPFALLTSEPNPAAASTTIRYRLGTGGPVSLRIFDVSGRLVRSLFEGQQGAAEHRLPWDGRDDAGLQVPSGVYFYRLNAAGKEAVERVVIIR